MAQNVPVTRKYKDVSGFIKGVNSFLDPVQIDEAEVVWAENASNRGGMWQTRPGFKSLLNLCLLDGSSFAAWWTSNGMPAIHPQFFTVFIPTGGDPQIVFGVSGSVFTVEFMTNGSLGPPNPVVGLQFDPTAPQLVAVSAVRSADIVAGLKTNITPYNVLMIQDGVSRAGYWDGTAGGHLNPQKLWKVDAQGNTLFQSGFNETRIGLWMDWSGNRLWVSNGNQVFSSDQNDPFHFTEETIFTNIPVFTFPGNITAVKDRGVSGIQQGLVFIFTENDTWSLWSGVQNRTQWITTGDFQRRVFSGTGCIAGKSPINHMGFMYWYSNNGVVSLDTLGTVTATQFVPPVDVAMANSKRRMSPDKSLVCSGNREGYVFWSVPMGPVAQNGRVYNNHTQVLDVLTTPPPIRNGPFYAVSTPTWQGVWTGIRPIEWATATIFGATRCFTLSMDFDGTPRIWEAFQGNRSDNGNPISWAIQTKIHPVTESIFVQSILRHFRILFEQIYGNLAVVGSWKGMRGKYHELLNTVLTSTPGSILLDDPSRIPITNSTINDSFSKQFRDVRSMDNREPDTTCQSTGVEAPYNDGRDRAFGLLLEMEGDGAILAYRIATDTTPENTEGEVSIPESGLRELSIAECPQYTPGPLQSFILNDSPLSDAFTPYISIFPETQYISAAPSCAFPTPTVATPVVLPGSGDYFENIFVSITTPTPGATIRYTLDGSAPSETNGIVYVGLIPVMGSALIKAIAYEPGYNDSSVVEANYNFGCISNPAFTSWVNAVIANGGGFTANSKSVACDVLTQLASRSYASKIVYLLPLIGSNLKAALTPLVNTLAIPAITNTAFVDGDFSEAHGLQGDGSTKILTLGVGPGYSGTPYNGGLGYWENNLPDPSATFRSPFGCGFNDGVGSQVTALTIGATVTDFNWDLSGDGEIDYSQSAINGHYFGQRTSSTNRQLYVNGTSVATSSTNDNFNPSELPNLCLMGTNYTNIESPSIRPWGGRCACAYLTDGTMSSSDVADFHSLLNTYLISPLGR